MSIIMQYGSGGGKAAARKMALLWSNSDTTSSFAAQTVNLSDSVLNYDFMLVTYAFSTGSQDFSSVLIPVSEIYTNAAQYNLNINAGANNRTGNRKINVPTATTAAFGTGAFNGSASSDGNVIPAAIYGVKL